MAKIVGVHGVGHDREGRHYLEALWLPALQDGLDRVDERLSPDDFQMAFYGDVYRPAPIASPGGVEGLLGVAGNVVGSARDAVADFLDRLNHAVLGTALARELADSIYGAVGEYFRDEELRDQVRSRVREAIGPDTRVVVAHSLGTVVAYEVLATMPHHVTTFVTLGSPLGLRRIVFERLEPAPVAGQGVWPGSVQRWVNIADGNDPVARESNVSHRFGGGVVDVPVDNGLSSPHDPISYLTARATGLAVWNGLDDPG